jgi:hypothetical protein
LEVLWRGKVAYCWYILVGLTVLSCGRAVEVALWTTGLNTLAIEAILLYFTARKGKKGKKGMKGEDIFGTPGRCRILECTE